MSYRLINLYDYKIKLILLDQLEKKQYIYYTDLRINQAEVFLLNIQ